MFYSKKYPFQEYKGVFQVKVPSFVYIILYYYIFYIIRQGGIDRVLDGFVCERICILQIAGSLDCYLNNRSYIKKPYLYRILER